MGNPRGVRRDFQALEKRRMAAVKLFGEDLNSSEISRRLKVCNQTVVSFRQRCVVEVEAGRRRVISGSYWPA